ncbi:MAG: carboxypeptidase regulatory-like domain-containing protein [Fibrobacter sp.]|nr:carboxypeptidase regulatory-like domain-containing protein [Fibrobacter sp.]
MKLLSKVFACFGWALCTAFFCNCSQDSVANGTGSNAGETELAGVITVTGPSGEPLAHAAARVWILHDNTIKIAYEDTLNESGTLEFKSTISREDSTSIQLIETHSGDSLSAMRWVDLEKKPSQTLTADSSVPLKGIISNNGNPVEGATITILDKFTITSSDGSFEFESLPSGVHYAFVESGFGKFSYQMQTGLAESATTNQIDLADSIFTVVEDFENWATRQTLLGKSFGQGWWFICTDSLQGGGSRTSEDLRSPNTLVSGDSAKNGSSLHVKFDIDEETEGHYGVAGFAIGDDFEEDDMFSFYDLRSATAISFDLKGSGELFLQITKRGDDGSREYHKTKPIPLTDEWQHVTMTAEDFDTELVAVNSLNFMVESDAEIFLDNIRFDGISPSMWPSLGMRF